MASYERRDRSARRRDANQCQKHHGSGSRMVQQLPPFSFRRLRHWKWRHARHLREIGGRITADCRPAKLRHLTVWRNDLSLVERRENFRGCLVTLRRLLGQHLLDDGGEFLRYVRAELRYRRGLADLMPHQFLRDRAVLVRALAREKEIERDAEAVYVAADIDGGAIDRLFGSDVVGGSENMVDVAAPRQLSHLVIEEARQSEVQNLDRTAAVEKQVSRLDVAMHQAGFVRMLQTVGRLRDAIDGAADRKRAEALDDRVQVRAVDVFEHKEVHFAFVIDIVC